MPLSISFLIPNVTDFLELEVEEVAGVLLMLLNSRDDGGAELNYHRFFGDVRNISYTERQQEARQALMEAWDCLASAGFIARKPDTVGALFFITRRGRRLKSREDFSAYRKANLLPKGQTHPLLARVYPAFCEASTIPRFSRLFGKWKSRFVKPACSLTIWWGPL